jgi:NitT/TauT family transport system ATP-binding protein
VTAVSQTLPEIAFEHVGKTFVRSSGGAPFEAIRDLSFTIFRGELVAILGKTGCGKSTTFSLISGLIRPSRGRVAVQGHDPYGEFNWFRGKIGIVFQNDRLMPWRTALDNVALGMELNKVPERERRDIAAALLCDEPFSALDEHTGDTLRREFRDLLRETGATSIFITHSIDEALQLGERLMVFERPARIAFETKLAPGMSEAERSAVAGRIRQVLSGEIAA